MHRPRHKRPMPAAPAAGIALTAMAAAAVALPLASTHAASQPVKLDPRVTEAADTGAARVQQADPVRARVLAVPASYTVRPGNYLSGISAKLCGTPGDYRALAYNNKIADPDMITPGEVIRAACHAAAAALARAYPPPKPVVHAALPVTETAAAPREATVSVSGGYGCSALEALWEEAGGNPGSAETAASVAMAESGGNPDAVSPTADVGLFQINSSHGPAMATLDPLNNARAAVEISSDGRDWSAWTTFREGLEAGRC